MKRSLAVALFAWPIWAGAQSPCEPLEFAEMDAMPREELLRIRCEYQKDMLDPRLLQAGRWGLAAANRCALQTERMDRILGRKYGIKPKSGDDAPYYREVNALCPR